MVEHVHATAIDVAGHGVLIRGPSGAGKSDLALRCLALGPTGCVAGGLLDRPPRLIADDQVLLEPRSGRLVLRAPAAIAGLIEVHGLGIIQVAHSELAELVLVVDLACGTRIERMPEPNQSVNLCGTAVASVRLEAFQPSAPLKLVLALASALAGRSHAPI